MSYFGSQGADCVTYVHMVPELVFDAAKSPDVKHCLICHSCRKPAWKQFLSESVGTDKQLHLLVATAKQNGVGRG